VKPLKEIGAHPKDGQPVQLFDGKYGPYVKHGDLNASVPKGVDPLTFSLDAAVALIAEKGKAPKGKGGRTAKRAAPKKAAKKSCNLSRPRCSGSRTKAAISGTFHGGRRVGVHRRHRSVLSTSKL
jgi:DNA topoisomerase-1